jgi:hypothetical protein
MNTLRFIALCWLVAWVLFTTALLVPPLDRDGRARRALLHAICLLQEPVRLARLLLIDTAHHIAGIVREMLPRRP